MDERFSRSWALDDTIYDELESFLYKGGDESLLDIESVATKEKLPFAEQR